MPDKLGLAQLNELPNNSCDADWDKSLVSDPICPLPAPQTLSQKLICTAPTPRNPPVSSAAGDENTTPGGNSKELIRCASGGRKRTLSELLNRHAEKGTDCQLSSEEATQLGDVLRQWINAASSPYEGEDDFFKLPDDITLAPRHIPNPEAWPSDQSENTGL